MKQNSYGIYGVHGLKSEMWLSRVIEPGHISAHRHCATGGPHTMLGKAWGCRSQTLVEDFLTDGGQVYPRLGFLLDAPRAIPVVLRIGGGNPKKSNKFLTVDKINYFHFFLHPLQVQKRNVNPKLNGPVQQRQPVHCS